MRRLNSDASDKSIEDVKIPYLEIIAVGIIQFFLSLLVVNYGVFLMQFDIQGLHIGDSLWGAVTFVAASKIASPWIRTYCNHLNIIKRKVYRRNIIIAAVVLSCSLAVLSFFTSLASLIILFGIFGGILSSVISVHLDFATTKAFKHNPRLFSFLQQLTKALCLLTTPHLILYFTNVVGASSSFLVLSGFTLTIIPICFLVRTKKKHNVRLCKFQTMDQLSIEMKDLNSVCIDNQSSSEESLNEEDQNEQDVPPTSIEPIPNQSEDNKKKVAPLSTDYMQKYYENVGVNILPNIPEESDTEEDDDINDINSKRLSRISAILQGLNKRRSSNFSDNNLFQPEEVEDNVPEYVDVAQKKSRCFRINSSTIFALNLKSFPYWNFGSCGKTLRTPQFYPALISNTITTFLSTVILAAVPYLMHLTQESKSLAESTFLLTIIGFTWLFLFVGYPVFNNLSSLKTNIFFLVGLSLSGLSLFIDHHFRHDRFILFSITFGLGYGSITYAENMAYEDFFGKVNWKLLQGALEISTGLFVILVYLIIYFLSSNIRDIIVSYVYLFYIFDVGLWTAAYFIKKIVIYVKNTGRHNLERYPRFDF